MQHIQVLTKYNRRNYSITITVQADLALKVTHGTIIPEAPRVNRMWGYMKISQPSGFNQVVICLV